MASLAQSPANARNGTFEIIAFRISNQEFCVRTTTIREIRGWAPSTPVPHAPPDIVGVMNLRGTVIPIIDLAYKLGMRSTQATERAPLSLPRCMRWCLASSSTASRIF